MSDEVVESPPKVAVSVDLKLNLGNYESMGASMMISGLRAGATEAEVNELIQTGQLAFGMIERRIRAELADSRHAHREARNGAR